jgi:hypothetical protein
MRITRMRTIDLRGVFVGIQFADAATVKNRTFGLINELIVEELVYDY